MQRILLAAAAVLLAGAMPQSASAFSLSFVQGLLGDLGVNVDLPDASLDLPPRAEQAVADSLSRAESALDRVFGDGGLLSGIDVHVPTVTPPQVNVPDVDQIVQDALDTARAAQSDALARAQAAIDSALGRANNVLDGINLPGLPDVEQIVSDALGDTQLSVNQALDQADSILGGVNVPDVDQILGDAVTDAQSAVDRALDQANSLIDDLDLPDVDQILEDALGRGESAVSDALGSAGGALDRVQDLLDGIDLSGVGATVESALDRATGVIDEVLGSDVLDNLLSDLPASLPAVAQQAIDRAFSHISAIQLPQQSAAAVPEPATAGLLSLGLLAGVCRRRR